MHKQREKYDTNRDMKRKPRKGNGCCFCCDSIIRDGQKCPVCGQKKLPIRNKK